MALSGEHPASSRLTVGRGADDRVREVVLVLRALGLGDLLTALPALRGLRRGRPAARVVLATTAGVAPLARLALPGTAVVAVAELGPLPIRGGVDLAVNLHGRGPRSHALLAAAAPRRLVGYDHPGSQAWSEVEGCHEVERWCRLVDPLVPRSAPVDRHDLDLAPAGLAVAPGDRRRSGERLPASTTLVHPGAASGSRRWPVERWIQVARAERRRGHPVVVTGTAGERSMTAAIVDGAGLPPAADLAGRTDVVGLARVVAQSARVVCGDTGVAHLATALARPSVVLFGPTSPDRWGPPPHRRRHVVLWAGRTGDPHATTTDPGLLAIGADDVVAALHTLDRWTGNGRHLRPRQPAADGEPRPIGRITSAPMGKGPTSTPDHRSPP